MYVARHALSTDEKFRPPDFVDIPGTFGAADPHEDTPGWVVEDPIVDPFAHAALLVWDIVEVGGGVDPLGDLAGHLERLDVPEFVGLGGHGEHLAASGIVGKGDSAGGGVPGARGRHCVDEGFKEVFGVGCGVSAG